ncbi:MAG: hypothetical protein DDT40_00834 [candidate division WS2 bacterium]|nr:hypothetical protein [Candidatus Psychracetigena formicireducens]
MIKGTIEYYQGLYLDKGLEHMIHELRKQYPHTTHNRFKGLVKTILYGADNRGMPNTHPSPAVPGLPPLEYKFRSNVFEKWTKKMRGG